MKCKRSPDFYLCLVIINVICIQTTGSYVQALRFELLEPHTLLPCQSVCLSVCLCVCSGGTHPLISASDRQRQHSWLLGGLGQWFVHKCPLFPHKLSTSVIFFLDFFFLFFFSFSFFFSLLQSCSEGQCQSAYESNSVHTFFTIWM